VTVSVDILTNQIMFFADSQIYSLIGTYGVSLF
jgi:hypothetical protein